MDLYLSNPATPNQLAASKARTRLSKCVLTTNLIAAQVVEALENNGIAFGSFDILTDQVCFAWTAECE